MLLRQRLNGDDYEVWSAGTRAEEGAPLHPMTAVALTAQGIRVRRHRARRLTELDLRGADLVLCATRRHRATVALMSSDAPRRTFTVEEFARLVPSLGPSAQGGGLRGVVERAASMRGVNDHLAPGSDDLPDPIRGDAALHDQVVRRLAAATSSVAKLLSQAAAGSSG
jgi:protein-tyrosine phosphatase